MLLCKLKTVSAVVLALAVGVGAVGMTYRLMAAESGQPAAGPAAARATADDIEALRWEIEALRKSLQATRERVKALEADVATLQARGQAAPGMMGGGMGMMRGGLGGGGALGMMGGGGPAGGLAPAPGLPGNPNPFGPGGATLPKAPADPLAEAEAALRQLRQHPNDKQAADTLERALKQLKERSGRGALDEAPDKPRTDPRAHEEVPARKH